MSSGGQKGFLNHGFTSNLSVVTSSRMEYAPNSLCAALMAVRLAAQPSQTSKLAFSPWCWNRLTVSSTHAKTNFESTDSAEVKYGPIMS